MPQTRGLRPSAALSSVADTLGFAVGPAQRHRRIPRRLTGPGAISYSICLVHPVLPAGTDGMIGR